MSEDHERPAPSASPTARHHSPLQKIRALLSPKNADQPITVTEDHILSILESRRGRERSFGRDLFADPAWDVLLELYAARLGMRRIGIKDLARSIDIPESTTRRWVAALAKREFVTLLASEREWVELTADGASIMKRLMDYWGAAFRSI